MYVYIYIYIYIYVYNQHKRNLREQNQAIMSRSPEILKLKVGVETL